MLKLTAIAGASLLMVGTAAQADPWKDESGQGRGGYEQGHRDHGRSPYRPDWDRDDRDRRYGYGIPRGHRPPPGMCRVWFRDRPAGRQPEPMSCRRARNLAYRYGGEVIRGDRRR